MHLNDTYPASAPQEPSKNQNFLKAVRGRTFDLGGLKLDFTNDNQGSDFVQLAYFDKAAFANLTPQQLAKIFQQ